MRVWLRSIAGLRDTYDRERVYSFSTALSNHEPLHYIACLCAPSSLPLRRERRPRG